MLAAALGGAVLAAALGGDVLAAALAAAVRDAVLAAVFTGVFVQSNTASRLLTDLASSCVIQPLHPRSN